MERLTGRPRLNPNLSQEIKMALGQSAQEKLVQERQEMRENKQRLTEAEKQLKEAETISVQRQQAATEVQNLPNRIEQTQARIDALEEEQGSNVESENELQRLKKLKENLQVDLENQKNQLVALQKIQKAKDKNKQK